MAMMATGTTEAMAMTATEAMGTVATEALPGITRADAATEVGAGTTET
jgi:hypothetical protein